MTSTIDFFQLSPLPMWVADISTHAFLDVNKAAINLFGYSKEEFLNMTLVEIEKKEIPAMDKGIAKMVSSAVHQEPHALQKKSGKIVYVHIVSNPIKYDGKQGELSLITDLTERIESEKKMIESVERFNIVSKATSDTIWDWNLSSKTMIWNRGIKGIFGHKDIINHTTTSDWWCSNIHPEDRVRVISKIEQHISAKIPRWQDEYRFACGDGSYKYVFDRGFVLFDDSGNPLRVIGAMEDVTSRKEYIRAIEDQNKKFKEIAWIQSHMVRAPLARIMALVELIKNYDVDEDYYTMLDYLSSSAKELDSIIINMADKAP